MLRGKLKLHDILDTEAFVERLIQRSGLELSFHEHEDLSTFLIESCWELSLRYQEGIIRKGFSTWAGITLGRRIADWQRSSHRGGRTRWVFSDRTYERQLPGFVSLDDRPGCLDAGRSLDAEVDSHTGSLAGLLGEGSSTVVRRADSVGKAPTRIAA